jgi:tRNA (cytosine38-C5)-methyltransferase
MTEPVKLTALEFYSGIGGWSAAASLTTALPFQWASSTVTLSIEVKAAFDINPIANDVYLLNHALKPNHRSLEHITVKNLDAHRADLWMMSPPCQPFTRNNDTAVRDKVDPRTASFVHLQELLQQMQHQPRLIFLENVVGFESSESCEEFLQRLSALQYQVQQFHLSPLQFGIPNDRPRYYCIAHKVSSATGAPTPIDTRIYTSFPDASAAASVQRALLSQYLDAPLSPDLRAEYRVPDRVLSSSSGWCLDLRTPASDYSACFTKSYSRFARGTGSVLVEVDAAAGADAVSEGDTQQLEAYLVRPRPSTATAAVSSTEPEPALEPAATSSSEDRALWWERLQRGAPRPLTIRYFTPQELLRLFGFPKSFRFPAALNKSKCYELIGNSVNVEVVARLLAHGLQAHAAPTASSSAAASSL